MTDQPLPRVVISDDVRKECERKGVTDPETLHNLAMFETFLAHAGPAAPLELAVTEGPDAVRAWHAEHLTPEQRAFRKAAFADPEWREWLGLPPSRPSQVQMRFSQPVGRTLAPTTQQS